VPVCYLPNQRHLRRVKSKQDERCLQVELRALRALSLKVLKDQGQIMYIQGVCKKVRTKYREVNCGKVSIPS